MKDLQFIDAKSWQIDPKLINEQLLAMATEIDELREAEKQVNQESTKMVMFNKFAK